MNCKLIVGLGNVGEQYKNTRHNIGFIVLDSILKQFNISIDKQMTNSLIAKVKINNQDVIFAKPTTFMNLSGKAVIELINFFKISLNDILVICDDLDQELGKYKIKTSGSSGGHNGLKDIIKFLGTENFLRFRIGIGRPKNKQQVIDYVLSKFNSQDLVQLQPAITKVATFIDLWTKNDLNQAISKTNNK